MLNKDQYNQDAYNDVYIQATAEAEIKHSEQERGKSKLLLIFILLALIGVLGYFVWKSLNVTDENSSNIIQKENIAKKTEDESLELSFKKILEGQEEEQSNQETTTIEDDKQKNSNSNSSTADIVANIVSQTNSTKMSPTDIARIVQLVTEQMQTEKKEEETIVVPKKKDSLETSLENFDIGTESSESLTTANVDNSQKKEATDIKSSSNTYNKIIVTKESIDNEDLNNDLNKLSMEIENVINSNNKEEKSSTQSTKYTSSLSKEVDTRKKEMRYHIVQKGETLATIAKKIYGSSQDYIKLYQANPDILRRADRIYIGQRLRVPE